MIKSSEYVTLDLSDYLKYLGSKIKTIIIITLLGVVVTSCFSLITMKDRVIENTHFLFNDEEVRQLKSYIEYKNSIELLEEDIKNYNEPEEVAKYSEAIEKINTDIAKLQIKNDCLNRFSSYSGSTEEELEVFFRSEVTDTTIIKVNHKKIIVNGMAISLIGSVLYFTNYYLYFIAREKDEKNQR